MTIQYHIDVHDTNTLQFNIDEINKRIVCLMFMFSVAFLLYCSVFSEKDY